MFSASFQTVVSQLTASRFAASHLILISLLRTAILPGALTPTRASFWLVPSGPWTFASLLSVLSSPIWAPNLLPSTRLSMSYASISFLASPTSFDSSHFPCLSSSPDRWIPNYFTGCRKVLTSALTLLPLWLCFALLWPWADWLWSMSMLRLFFTAFRAIWPFLLKVNPWMTLNRPNSTKRWHNLSTSQASTPCGPLNTCCPIAAQAPSGMPSMRVFRCLCLISTHSWSFLLSTLRPSGRELLLASNIIWRLAGSPPTPVISCWERSFGMLWRPTAASLCMLLTRAASTALKLRDCLAKPFSAPTAITFIAAPSAPGNDAMMLCAIPGPLCFARPAGQWHLSNSFTLAHTRLNVLTSLSPLQEALPWPWTWPSLLHWSMMRPVARTSIAATWPRLPVTTPPQAGLFPMVRRWFRSPTRLPGPSSMPMLRISSTGPFMPLLHWSRDLIRLPGAIIWALQEPPLPPFWAGFMPPGSGGRPSPAVPSSRSLVLRLVG